MKLFYLVDPLRLIVNDDLPDVVRGLAHALQAQGCGLTFVAWDATNARLATVEAAANADPFLLDVPVAGSEIVAPPYRPGDWLVVPEVLRSQDTAGETARQLTDFCTRLGIKTAFVFYDAAPLRDVQQGDRVAAYSAYMQQLALADLIIPASVSAADDLVSFFLNRLYFQMETLPVIAPVPLPAIEHRAAATWLEYAQQVLGLIRDSNTPWLHIKKIFYWVDQSCRKQGTPSVGSTVRELAASLQRTSISVTPVKWSAGSKELVIPDEPELISFDGAPTLDGWDRVPPGKDENGAWLLIPEFIIAYPADTIHSVIEFAKSKRLKVALLYSEPADELEAQSCRAGYAGWVGLVDRVLCATERDRDGLLSYCKVNLERLVNIKQRLLILSARQDGGNEILQGLSEGVDWRTRVYPAEAVLPSRAAFHAPILSICISTYNRARWLEISLPLLLKQTAAYRDVVEVIVCDNTSTDDTPEVMAPHLNETNFRYIRNAKNVGMLGNLKVTAQHTRGQYVWILGDDDLLFDGTVERVLKAILEHPDVSLIYLNYAYTRIAEANKVVDLERFLHESIPIIQPGPDLYAPVSRISTLSPNFFTAIYCLVYRRDHALLAYSQNTEGRPFSTMLTCIPTSHYVCHHMMDEPGYWIGDPCVLVNMNVSWGKYVPLWVLERLPELFDLAEMNGARPDEVDHWRADNMPGVLHYLKKIYFSDAEKNIEYFSIERFIARHKHLKEFRLGLNDFMSTYEKAYRHGHAYARIEPQKLLAKFCLQNE